MNSEKIQKIFVDDYRMAATLTEPVTIAHYAESWPPHIPPGCSVDIAPGLGGLSKAVPGASLFEQDDHYAYQTVRLDSADREFSRVLTCANDNDQEFAEKYYRVRLYADAAPILSELDSSVAQPQEDDRHQFIRSVLKEYRQTWPDDNFDGTQPGSFAAVDRFMELYVSRLPEVLELDRWHGIVNNGRMLFLQSLQSAKARQLIHPAGLELAITTALSTPAIINDPISSLVGLAKDGEAAGKFEEDNRTIRIDISTIAALVAEHDPSETVDVEQGLYMVLFHEFVHAFTASQYWRRSDGDYKVTSLWPDYWYEGFTDKLALVLLAEVFELQEPASLFSGEKQYKNDIGHTPRQMGVSQKSKRYVDKAGSFYREYRLLIDVMFDSLDWRQAGLTERKAENLAMRAFTEPVTYDGLLSTSENSARYRFIKAVGDAAHEGFLPKFHGLASTLGGTVLMGMLSDPDFDIHDPQGLPYAWHIHTD